jgi:ketosteroid isomerase-like protein
MKKIFFLAIMAAIFTFSAQAQNAQTQVSSAIEFLKQAMISGDSIALKKIAAENLQYGHSGGKLEDKAAFVNSIASGASDFVSIDLTEQIIKITGKIAVVRHKLAAITNDKGKPGEVKLGVMLVFAKQNGDWKLLARQAYKI